MRRSLLFVLLITLHFSSATIDLEKIKTIKATAAEKLHTLTGKAATGLQELTEKAATGLHELTDKAASELHQLKDNAAYNLQHWADDIDLNNLNKLDVLHVIPTLKSKLNFIKKKLNQPDTKVNVIHIYGDDLSSHFKHAKLVKVKTLHHHLPHHYHHHHDDFYTPFPLKRLYV